MTTLRWKKEIMLHQISILSDYTRMAKSVKEIIIQKNTKGYGQNFNRDWLEYKRGFGSIEDKTYWMGLDEINKLTTSGSYSLEIHLEKNGVTNVVKWSSFKVGSELEKYKLSISGFDAGTSGLTDQLAYHNGKYFTTRDKDNDKSGNENCAQLYGSGGSGWWFYNCYSSQLNKADSSGPSYSDSYDESTMILKR